jgi:ferrochelatase
MGVILVNLGTPDAPKRGPVRRFLRQFLSDRRVVSLNPVFWRSCLELCVLPVRSGKSAAKYASVWYPEGSPLLVHTAAQAQGLAQALEDAGIEAGGDRGVQVVPAMRYGKPSLPAALAGMRARGIDRVLIVPMFPQYSSTTVASVNDEVARDALRTVNQFEIRTVRSFPTDPGYIDALIERIEQTWTEHGRPDFGIGHKLILSFHGIPEACVAAGDTYPRECEATAAAVRERLGLSADQCLLTYQSKFGPAQWLTPATIDTVARLGREGCPRVDVMCPGFTADCLESLEEIELLNREAYEQAFAGRGGEHGGAGAGKFVRIACLNETPRWIEALKDLVLKHTEGWR